MVGLESYGLDKGTVGRGMVLGNCGMCLGSGTGLGSCDRRMESCETDGAGKVWMGLESCRGPFKSDPKIPNFRPDLMPLFSLFLISNQ